MNLAMKKKWLIALLFPFLISCSGGDYYQKAYHNASYGMGGGASQLTAFQTDQEGPFLLSPFSSSSSLWVYYQQNQSLAGIEKTFNETLQWTSAYMDRHYGFRTKEENVLTNVYQINRNSATSTTYILNEVLYDTLKFAYDMTLLTEGAFHFGIGALSSLFDAYIEEAGKYPGRVYQAIKEEERLAALAKTPSLEELKQMIAFDEKRKAITVSPLDNQKRLEITLGGVGKGKAVEVLRSKLSLKGYISAGESSITTFSKSIFEHWSLLLRNPLYQEALLTGNPVVNQMNPFEIRFQQQGIFSFSTSGDYQKFYYDEAGNRIHHIINPRTGSNETFHRAVAIVGPRSDIADVLSTALMNVTREEGKAIVKRVNETYGETYSAIWFDENSLNKNALDVYVEEAIAPYVSLDKDAKYPNVTTLHVV